MKRSRAKKLKWALTLLGGGVILSFIGLVVIYMIVVPGLPSIEALKDIKYQVPLRVYSTDNKLIGEFGEKRRLPLSFEQIPPLLINAVLATEDDRFYEHSGVDYRGLLRAVVRLITTGHKVEGGSTITMQVARNFFLSSEKTFLRKFSEILLAMKIERELSKNEILALYLNKIYFGNRAYGVAAAAQIYYGKEAKDLNAAQLAMIAGLPKAPSKFNPAVDPDRAQIRRDYILKRMLGFGFIDERTYQAALQEPVNADIHGLAIEVDASYAAEMVRAEMFERYGADAYTTGFQVYTSIDARMQDAANRALHRALMDYETRHGYRGPEAHLPPLDYSQPEEWLEALQSLPSVPDMEAGVVIDIEDQAATLYTSARRTARVCWNGMNWAARVLPNGSIGAAPKKASDIFKVGDVVRLEHLNPQNHWALTQIPEVEGALISLSPQDGGIKAIVGGYEFFRSKFNRVTQAKRQPGSNFKPFVYSAALDKGFNPATIINDAPVVFEDAALEDTWRPENFAGEIAGPTRFREALVKSRNLVSIRILRAIGTTYAIDYAKRFGFDGNELPHDLSLALGSASVTPLAVARGYAVFANGGYLVNPHLFKRIVDGNGVEVYRANQPTVCTANCDAAPTIAVPAAVTSTAVTPAPPAAKPTTPGTIDRSVTVAAAPPPPPQAIAPRVLDARNVYLMTSIMRDVIQRGTGRAALSLKRGDLAGKTGTTNDQRDTWFSGFTPDLATTTWVGYDQPTPLGEGESGARAALPMWIDYMAEALRNFPEKPLREPPGLVTVRIDPESGQVVAANYPGAIFETFREEDVASAKGRTGPARTEGTTARGTPTESLF
ncbi:MAG: penicillin-binding protein 1A [Gammaproteobacteria bacterium]|nr:penicillin-binding protein 1A [Gammaproteobacteria bacterium]